METGTLQICRLPNLSVGKASAEPRQSWERARGCCSFTFLVPFKHSNFFEHVNGLDDSDDDMHAVLSSFDEDEDEIIEEAGNYRSLCSYRSLQPLDDGLGTMEDHFRGLSCV
jgi:hypothetical protein